MPHLPEETLDPGLLFAGQLEDKESGLVYNRFRYYHPKSGCYLSPDPIGLAGGENTHGYVPNPVDWIDPYGLNKKSIIASASKWQGKGDYPGVDEWIIESLKKGDIIYGGVPG